MAKDQWFFIPFIFQKIEAGGFLFLKFFLGKNGQNPL